MTFTWNAWVECQVTDLIRIALKLSSLICIVNWSFILPLSTVSPLKIYRHLSVHLVCQSLGCRPADTVSNKTVPSCHGESGIFSFYFFFWVANTFLWVNSCGCLLFLSQRTNRGRWWTGSGMSGLCWRSNEVSAELQTAWWTIQLDLLSTISNE